MTDQLNFTTNINELLEGKEWGFVEFSEEELATFTPPENSLNGYMKNMR